MNKLNIHKDSRDRGLEVLLYQVETEDLPSLDNNQKKCKLKVKLPLLFGREFHFYIEFYIIIQLKPSESK